MILADLGAEVIKVEPVDGDRTRKLQGFGGGFFGYFNRNKKSLALDADAPEGRAVLVKLLQSADVLIENFAPGSMSKRGLGPEHLEKINPRLVYCALKGFLPGPYEKRPALDEVVQMMGGLAYMTGPIGPAACAPAPRWSTSWAACSAPSARCWRCSSASAPARAGWSRARCSNRWCS